MAPKDYTTTKVLEKPELSDKKIESGDMSEKTKTSSLVSKTSLSSCAYFAVFLILFLLLFHEFFFSSRTFYERDMTLIEIPSRKLCVKLLREGNFALWTDAHGNGQPFLANPKNAVLYPTTWLYLVLPFFTAFKFHYSVHVIICWLGLYFLSQSYGLTRRASFLGASLFIFSGIYLSSFEFYNHIAALAWMPWVLFCLNKNFPLKLKKLICISPLWALMILAGTPEVIFIALFLAIAQSFFNKGEWKKRILAACISLVLASCITAVQLLPSLEMLAQTDRQEQARTWPLELVQLVNVAFPHFLGNDRQPGHNDFWGRHLFDRNYPLYYSLYLGLGALILATLALKKTFQRKRKVLLWTGFLFFLISCGRYSPFFFLYRLFPVIGSIRYPVKFLLGSVFCLSLLAALGYQNIEGRGEKKQKSAFLLILIAAGISAAYWAFKAKILSGLNLLLLIDKESSVRDLARSIETGLFLFSLYAILLFFRDKNRLFQRATLIVILALAVLDPAFHNRYVNPTVPIAFFAKPELAKFLGPSKTIYRNDSLPPNLKTESMNNVRFFHYLYQTLYPYSALGHDVRYVLNRDLYASYSREHNALMKDIQALPQEAKLKILEYLGCSYAVGDKRIFTHRPGIEWKINGKSVWLESIADEKPSVYPVFQTVTAYAMEERIKLFIDPSFDPRRQAVTAKYLHLEEENPEEKKASIQVKKEIQGRAWYSVETPADTLVVIPSNYVRGWKARVDGKPVEVFEANVFSKAVLIPRGRHDIEIRYLPGFFLWGAALSLISVGLALFLIIRHRQASP